MANSRRQCTQYAAGTYGFVEHARLPVLVLSARAVDEAVAQHVVVDATVSAHSVAGRAREPLHAVVRQRTLCNDKHSWPPLLPVFSSYRHLLGGLRVVESVFSFNLFAN